MISKNRKIMYHSSAMVMVTNIIDYSSFQQTRFYKCAKTVGSPTFLTQPEIQLHTNSNSSRLNSSFLLIVRQHFFSLPYLILHPGFSYHWLRLSLIWRILQISESDPLRLQAEVNKPEICWILQSIRESKSIIASLTTQNIPNLIQSALHLLKISLKKLPVALQFEKNIRMVYLR